MKIQELAIIFVIIILPISLLLSEYTQFQIQTINTQTLYDSKLTTATYDAIKAFQLNTAESTTSDLANSKLRDLEASISTFMNSISAAFEMNGYTKEDLNNYIPALVYTLYDGLYIYSPYENTHDESGNRITGDKEFMYGLKPYINYSCRYKTTNTDVVITYALDNYITVQGEVDGEYVNKSGYLIDGITVTETTVKYNGVQISTEQLKEYLPIAIEGVIPDAYPYAKINGTKYYLIEDKIVYILNGTPVVQCKNGDTQYDDWKNRILNNNNAQQYYREAENFTKWVKIELIDLEYGHAVNETGTTKIWNGDTTKIFDDSSNNIENESSNFNQHRLEVIRHKIETNLAIAIANYNEYSGADNVFQMPNLKETEWDDITHNISLISFLQGLPIGGKVYNGYTLVTNSESKEVVLENNIYILGSDSYYHKIGDKGFGNGTIDVNAGAYGSTISAGRLNLDFERDSITSGNVTNYYYPLKDYNASYDSIVMQNNVNTYDDIYEYVNNQSSDLKTAFYTALGRERYGMYKSYRTN